jgi:hypothetical protein
MRIVAQYPFNNGINVVTKKYPRLLDEIRAAIKSIDASKHKTKKSKEKTMRGKMLYSPISLNAAFKKQFDKYKWGLARKTCVYSTKYYVKGYKFKIANHGQFRAMDFVKDELGIEIQFGKYSFMVYNVAAKMTIFKNLGYIKAGVEIVPVKSFVDDMSSGVSYFEQFVWDLENRGKADIDIPVMILGIDA